jgi:hypothetical protein
VKGSPDLEATPIDFADQLLFYRHCESGADFWTDSEEVEDDARSRTFRVRLGLKTKEGVASRIGYRFEVVAAAHVIVAQDKANVAREDLATQYGLSLLFGIIRETLTSNTARMQNGKVYLPTFSFLGTKYIEVSTPASGQATLPLDAADEPPGDDD